MRPDNALTLCSLRWHDPDQVLGSQEYLPLSPSIRTPLVENSIDYGKGFVNSVSVENTDPRGYAPTTTCPNQKDQPNPPRHCEEGKARRGNLLRE